MVDVRTVDPLAPRELKRVLAALAVGQALVVDLVLGRPCGRTHIAAVREAIASLEDVLAALDADTDAPAPGAR